ncbi:NSFL1 cofactor p47 [Drosophila hydei]|uniref:NSFL1 cofactor p47 n=1 Tax=Drosophila hydei TaxID=7224 RepID=A0A6J1L9G4_DROHY|nr:NSFL1 cofactor p47 [Drosophila hydei]
MSNEQKLASFMKKYDVQESVARHYLTTNNWALDEASIKYESDKATQRSSQAIPVHELQSMQSLLSHTRPTDDAEAYFAGASDSSMPPPNGNQQSRRVIIDDSTPALTTADSDRSLRAWGHGVRLGSAHPIIPPPVRRSHASLDSDSESELEQHERTIVVLHLWSEGFSLDNGMLRRYEVPENERFLRAIMRGDFPDEMQVLGRRIELTVRDRTNESYRELSRKQFMGFGRPLASPTPDIDLTARPSELLSSEERQQLQEQVAQHTLQLNGQTAMTTIQFRLANGNRIAAHFNTSHNVGDLYRYLRVARPQYATDSFLLITGFPRHDLHETDQRTLAEANLLNVLIIQHMNDEPEHVEPSSESN